LTALEEFPRELALSQHGPRWLLIISGPGVTGQVVGSREGMEQVAEVYAQMRRDQETPAADIRAAERERIAAWLERDAARLDESGFNPAAAAPVVASYRAAAEAIRNGMLEA